MITDMDIDQLADQIDELTAGLDDILDDGERKANRREIVRLMRELSAMRRQRSASQVVLLDD